MQQGRWNPERQQQLGLFKQALAKINLDIQPDQGYPPNTADNANMSSCSISLAERFGALVMTIEMPFWEAIGTIDRMQGWSPECCARLIRSFLDTLRLCWHEAVN